MTHATHTGGKSLVMHSAARHYDRLVWLLTLGRERALRSRLVDIAQLAPGEAVLDVGCGTGTLALEARRRVGANGTVVGVDAAPEMIARARRKAARAGVDVAFEPARAEALPFPDGRFDVVLSTLMMHHLSRPVRERLALEIRRVLRPGGRVLVVDFEPPAKQRGGLISRIHRHGHVPLREIVSLLREAGLQVADTGGVGFGDLQFALARNDPQASRTADAATPAYRLLPPLPRPQWHVPALVVAAVAAHGIVLHATTSRLALSTVAVLALALLVIASHGGLAGGVHALLRRHARH